MGKYFSWFFLSLRGRTGRRPYWLFFVLPFFLAGIAIGIAMRTVGLSEKASSVLLLALMVPAIWTYVAVGVKRIHDFGRSGWWVVIGLIPIVSWVALLLLGVIPGSRGANTFGADPAGERKRVT